jgi:septal ring factor EnvC (AmiA/AmiB activator)
MSIEIIIAIGVCLIIASMFVKWLNKSNKLQFRISNLDHDIKRLRKRFISHQDSLLDLWNIVNDYQTKTLEQTPDQKESQRRSFVYGTTKLSNSEVTEELVNEVAEEQTLKSKKTLFDDLWKIEPPVKK